MFAVMRSPPLPSQNCHDGQFTVKFSYTYFTSIKRYNYIDLKV